MVKKVLPPLDTKNQIANLAAPGEWKVEDATFLEKLAKGLKLGGQEEVSSYQLMERNFSALGFSSILYSYL